MKMKKLILPLRLLLIAVLIAAVALTIASCGNGTGTGTQKATEAATGEPEAKFELDGEAEVGEGAKTIIVNVYNKEAEDKSKDWFKVTVKTDAENLADALTENKVAEGSTSEYGLYITTLIVPLESGEEKKDADDTHFWSIEQNGEMLMTGASSTPISDGETFDFVYTAIKTEAN